MTHNPDCDTQDMNPDGIKKPCNCGEEPKSKAVQGLEEIINHPTFHPDFYPIAKDALEEISKLRHALLLYHEAWKCSSIQWQNKMSKASKNAEAVLYPKP